MCQGEKPGTKHAEKPPFTSLARRGGEGRRAMTATTTTAAAAAGGGDSGATHAHVHRTAHRALAVSARGARRGLRGRRRPLAAVVHVVVGLVQEDRVGPSGRLAVVRPALPFVGFRRALAAWHRGAEARARPRRFRRGRVRRRRGWVSRSGQRPTRSRGDAVAREDSTGLGDGTRGVSSSGLGNEHVDGVSRGCCE